MTLYWDKYPMSIALPVYQVCNILDEYIKEVKQGMLDNPSVSPSFKMFWLLFSYEMHKLEPPDDVMDHVENTRYWIMKQVREYKPYALAWVGLVVMTEPGKEDRHLLSTYVEYGDTTLAKQEEVIIRHMSMRDGSERVCIDFAPMDYVLPSLYNGRLANILGDQ